RPPGRLAGGADRPGRQGPPGPPRRRVGEHQPHPLGGRGGTGARNRLTPPGRLENEPGDGPIKTFTRRGIKDSPSALHDGRCLTREETVEFFNLVPQTNLTKEEKADLVAFLRSR